MNKKQRRPVLFIALACVVAWSAWLAFETPVNETGANLLRVVEPAARDNRTATTRHETTPANAPATAQEAKLRLALSRANLFPAQSWYVAPPPPPPPPAPPYVPPPPPQAPALPFSYMGRWQDAGHTTYYLARGSMPVNVHAGQVLDGIWRLEPVTGNLLNFTYLPLNQTRSLRIGD